MPTDLSIVIPVISDSPISSEEISRLVAKAASSLGGISYELILIHNGCISNSTAIAGKILEQRRVGFGGALREGFLCASGDYILTTSPVAALTTNILSSLWDSRLKSDIVIASRYVEGKYFGGGTSKRLNSISAKILDIPVTDLSSASTIYRRRSISPDKYQSEDMSILPEIVVRAYADGFSVAEIPFSEFNSALITGVKEFGQSFLSTLYSLWVLRNSVESADYDERAHRSKIPLQRYWQRKRHSLITGYLDSTKPDSTVLDIGCGSSRIIQGMPESVAFDFALRKIRYLKKSNKKRVRGSTFALPFANESFEQVIHSQVIEHIPFDTVIYTELNRVMKPSGNLIIGTPDYGRIWWPIIEYFYGKILPNAYADEHITHYTRRSLIDTLAQHGFRILHYSYICGGELIIKAKKVG